MRTLAITAGERALGIRNTRKNDSARLETLLLLLGMTGLLHVYLRISHAPDDVLLPPPAASLPRFLPWED